MDINEEIVLTDDEDDTLFFYITTTGSLGKPHLYVEGSCGRGTLALYATPEMLETLASELQCVAKLMRSQSAMSDFMEIFTEDTPEILPFDGVNLLTTDDIDDQLEAFAGIIALLEGDLHE